MIGSQEVMALWSNEGIEELSFFSAESNKPSFLAMKSTGGKLLVFQSVFLQKATNITHADASLGNEICSVNTSVEASLSIQQQPHVAVRGRRPYLAGGSCFAWLLWSCKSTFRGICVLPCCSRHWRYYKLLFFNPINYVSSWTIFALTVDFLPCFFER